MLGSSVAAEDLDRYVGKGVADKIRNGEGEVKKQPSGAPYARLSGLDLKIGGEWAINLYDKQIPNELNKYVKKWGGKVGTTKIETKAGAEAEQHSLEITPEMRDAISLGQPLFQTTRGAVRLAPGFRMIELFQDEDLSTILHELSHTYLDDVGRVLAINLRGRIPIGKENRVFGPVARHQLRALIVVNAALVHVLADAVRTCVADQDRRGFLDARVL